MAGPELGVGDTVEYAWSSAGRPSRGRNVFESNRLAGRVAAPPTLPLIGSLEEFIVEHYWGYARGRDGRTREYRVAHPPTPSGGLCVGPAGRATGWIRAERVAACATLPCVPHS